MAGLLATQMLDWRTRNTNLYENEFRGVDCGALEFHVAQNKVAGGTITAELEALALRSMGNTIKFPVLKRNTTASVSSSRACTTDNHETESALDTISWSVMRDGFWMFPNRYMNNDIAYQQHFDANMKDMINRFRAYADNLCLTNLSNQKTQVLAENLGYTVTGNVVMANGTDREDILIDLESMMRGNNYNGKVSIIGTPGIMNLYKKLAKHGAGNDINDILEYEGKPLYVTNNLSHTNKFAAMYAVAEGQVGFLQRLSRAQYNQSKSGNYEWGSLVLPGTGINFGITKIEHQGDMHSYLDASGADMTCDYGIEYVFEAEIAFVNKYNQNSASYAQPVIKAEIGNFVRGQHNVNIVNTSLGVAPAADTTVFKTQEVTE